MKKLVSLSLAIVVLTSFLAACAPPTPKVVEKVVITKGVAVTPAPPKILHIALDADGLRDVTDPTLQV